MIVAFSIILTISVKWVGQILTIFILQMRKLQPRELRDLPKIESDYSQVHWIPLCISLTLFLGVGGKQEVQVQHPTPSQDSMCSAHKQKESTKAGQFFSELHLAFICGKGFQFLLYSNPDQNVFCYPDFCSNLVKC